MTRRVKSAQPRAEHHNERIIRLVGEVHSMARDWGLPPLDAIYVLEGAADRVRREAEAKKRGGGR